MTKEQILKLVSGYVATYCKHQNINSLSKQELLLVRYDDGWGLEPLNMGGEVKKIIKMPELSGNETENQLKIASYLTVTLTEYFSKAKGNANRTAEKRKEIAKKAINARWAKRKNERIA